MCTQPFYPLLYVKISFGLNINTLHSYSYEINQLQNHMQHLNFSLELNLCQTPQDISPFPPSKDRFCHHRDSRERSLDIRLFSKGIGDQQKSKFFIFVTGVSVQVRSLPLHMKKHYLKCVLQTFFSFVKWPIASGNSV